MDSINGGQTLQMTFLILHNFILVNIHDLYTQMNKFNSPPLNTGFTVIQYHHRQFSLKQQT